MAGAFLTKMSTCRSMAVTAFYSLNFGGVVVKYSLEQLSGGVLISLEVLPRQVKIMVASPACPLIQPSSFSPACESPMWTLGVIPAFVGSRSGQDTVTLGQSSTVSWALVLTNVKCSALKCFWSLLALPCSSSCSPGWSSLMFPQGDYRVLGGSTAWTCHHLGRDLQCYFVHQ